MQLGFISSILDGWSFEETIDIASAYGFECIEVACWPLNESERRYAGVSHIDVKRVNNDDEYACYILDYCKKKKVRISSLAYYPNPLDEDTKKQEAIVKHLMEVIMASAKLKVNLVTTFIGRNQKKNVNENLSLVKEVWKPIVSFADKLEVRIAIENCPMLFGSDQWPGGQNIMTSPSIWREIFDILPQKNLGINYDPSHFVWQMMDYIKPLYEFKDKIFHVHFKDIKIYPEKLADCGVMAYPLEYMSPKLPGLGDVDWGKFVSALTDVGYCGAACIEVEDRAFEGSKERILDSLKLSKKYMDNYTI